MYSPGSSNSVGVAASSSTSASNMIPRPDPAPATLTQSLVRGRNRKQTELQQLSNEIQLLQKELNLLNDIPLASKACKDLVRFVENRSDPFFPNSDGVGPHSWPYDRPVKVRRCCWQF